MLIGHQKQRQYLKKMAELGLIPHALLFSGPEGIGRKKMALELSKLIFCESKTSEGPCGKCPYCRNADSFIHPDLIFISSARKEISIDQIRELKRASSLKPSCGEFKIAIIDDAHKMTLGAQNALLKTLEEPPGAAVIILISSKPERLTETVRSRVQQIKFFTIPDKEIEKMISDAGLPKNIINRIIQIARGRPGVALNLSLMKGELENYEKEYKEFSSLMGARMHTRFKYVETSLKKSEAKDIIEVWLEAARHLLLSAVKTKTQGQSGEYSKKLTIFIKNLQNVELIVSSTNVNQRLALEVLMLDMP